AYLGRKEFGPAEEVFRKMHQVDPADPRGLIGVKEVYVAENKSDKAIETLQLELRRHPGRMDYRMVLANTAERLRGDLDSAITALSKARAAEPENPQTIGALAQALDSAGRKQEAR